MKQLPLFIILMVFLVVGGIAGFLVSEMIITHEYANACDKQCNNYIDEYCVCFGRNPTVPLWTPNTEGENVIEKENKS